MSQTRAENYKSNTRDFSEKTKEGVYPDKSSGQGAREEGYRKRDNSEDRYEWKDSPYTKEKQTYTDWYIFFQFYLFYSFINSLTLTGIYFFQFYLFYSFINSRTSLIGVGGGGGRGWMGASPPPPPQ